MLSCFDPYSKEYPMKISSPLSVSSCTPRTTFRVSALVLALSAISVAVTHSQAAVSYSTQGTPSYSTLGDLSIYQPPTGETQPTVMLMLDKSGSMGNFYRSGYGRIDSLWVDYGSFDYQRLNYVTVEDREVPEREYICTKTNKKGQCIEGYYRNFTVIKPVDVTYKYQTTTLKGNNNQPCYYSDYDKDTV